MIEVDGTQATTEVGYPANGPTPDCPRIGGAWHITSDLRDPLERLAVAQEFLPSKSLIPCGACGGSGYTWRYLHELERQRIASAGRFFPVVD